MIRWPFLRMVTGRGKNAKLSILNYHRVHAETDPINPQEVDAKTFTWQMELIAKNFNVCTLSEAVEHMQLSSLPERALCITFDDGYADNADIALPILNSFSLKATFFIATGFLDGGRMWNDTVIESIRYMPSGKLDLSEKGLGRYHLENWQDRHNIYSAIVKQIKHLPQEERQGVVDWIASIAPNEAQQGELMMRSEQVRKLYENGMEIGGHTVTHPIFASITDQQAELEIAQGRQQLEAITGDEVIVFAYPNGKPGQDYLSRHRDMVERQGFKAAVSTNWGVSTVETDRFQLRRFTPWDSTPAKFMLRLIRNCYYQG